MSEPSFDIFRRNRQERGPKASNKASKVRALAERKACLTLDQHNSIGL